MGRGSYNDRIGSDWFGSVVFSAGEVLPAVCRGLPRLPAVTRGETRRTQRIKGTLEPHLMNANGGRDGSPSRPFPGFGPLGERALPFMR